jgi:hypothetical protein
MMAGRRSARTQFTTLYVAVFLLCGVGLLAIAVVISMSATKTTFTEPAPRQQQPSALSQAQTRINQLESQLAQVNTTQEHRILIGSLIALIVMAVVSLLVGRAVAHRVLRPLRDITAATRRITADNLHERLAVPGPHDEVKDLADTIDGLLGRLEASFSAQRRFVANASHELRTPLATMRAALDVAVAKPEPVPDQTVALADRMRAELDQVDRLLDGFLVLARAQHGALPDRATFPLGHLVAEAVTTRTGDITGKDLALRRTECEAWVIGSPTLLRRMVDNVIDNAIAHNHPGGWIRVTMETGPSAVRLAVETGGPVLDERLVADLARPFRRLGADRTGQGGGAGLGLSIVAAIAETHGGTLDLRARPTGGLWVGITLPLAVTGSAAGARAGAWA